MITLAIRAKVIGFIIGSALLLAFIAVKYANLGGYVGFRDYNVVKLELAETGGLYENSGITYRGVSVGRVGAIRLSSDGVVADLKIKKSVKVPSAVEAKVLNLSAVGEQYVDLRPSTAHGPYLKHGSVIPRRVTSTPAPIHDILSSVNGLAASVPNDALRRVIDELGKAFEGQGPNLRALIDESGAFTANADANIEPTVKLIVDGAVVLRTQNESGDALRSFARNAKLLAERLRQADGDLRALIKAAPGASGQLAGLLRDLDPSLSVLVANLLTTADLGLTRVNGLEELLVKLPGVTAATKTALDGGKFHFGQAVTFFNPLPCVSGYGTVYREGANTSPGPPLNTAASCTLPASSGVNVRGSSQAPKGGIPKPAVPGGLSAQGELPGALGLPSLPQNGPVDLRSLLFGPDVTPEKN